VSWSRFIDVAPAAEHAVQVYDGQADLVATVAPYLAAGLATGAPLLVVATDDHWRAFAAALPEDPAGLLLVRDAHEMLEAISVGGRVDADAFEQHIGGLVDELAARFPGRTLRAFGEMVDVLWQRGERDDAIALEELWNGLQETRPVALLCAYCVDVFDVDVQTGGLADVFRVHTHARPVSDTAKLSAALDQALSEVVGPSRAARVYLDVAHAVPRSSVPRAQAVLGWLCTNDRSTAVEVLARARAHYA
jgi:DcmR-like sensory protein